MSRSQLGGKENKQVNANHATTTTHLPNLHNMSTASLLSNCQYEKKHSMLSNRSNYGSQRKLNFKMSSKTPSNNFTEKTSSTKKVEKQYPLSDEEKLRAFHEKCAQQTLELK